MKKLLGSTLALAMFLPTGANAELFKNLKISGQLDVTAVSAHNVTDLASRGEQGDLSETSTNNDRLGHAFTRTMLSADWDLLDDVHARVTLVKGAHNLSSGAGLRNYGSGSETLSQWQDRTHVQEANVKIDKLMGLFDTTIGRQFYGEPGDLIVYYGPRDNYGFRTEALDTFRFDWKGEHMAVTGIAGRTADQTGAATLGNTGTATDLRGLVVSCNQHETVKPSVYLYNSQVHAQNGSGITVPPATVTGKNTNLYVLGLKAKVMAGGFSGHAEVAKNFGDDRSTFVGQPGAQSGRYTGYALLLKGGYKAEIPDAAAVNPWAEFGMGSGDANFAHAGNGNFQSINTDHRPGGVYGLFDQGAGVTLASGGGTAGSAAASNGLTNRVIFGAGVKATPAFENKLTVGAAWYRYAFHRVAPGVLGNGSVHKPSRNIGSEIDVTADWKHSDNVSLGITLGQFLPGAYLNDVADINGQNQHSPVRLAKADVKVRF